MQSKKQSNVRYIHITNRGNIYCIYIGFFFPFFPPFLLTFRSNWAESKKEEESGEVTMKYIWQQGNVRTKANI